MKEILNEIKLLFNGMICTYLVAEVRSVADKSIYKMNMQNSHASESF